MAGAWKRLHKVPVWAKIVCTGRGAHKPTPLLIVAVYPDHGLVETTVGYTFWRATASGRAAGPPADPLRYVRVPQTGEQTPEALESTDTWEFSCPRCPRTPRVRKSLIVTAVAQGMAEMHGQTPHLDVSYHD